MQLNQPPLPCSFLKTTPPGPDSGIEVKDQTELDEFNKKAITCRECGFTVTDNSFSTNVNNRHEHAFFNPHGYVFQIRCFSAAAGCVTIGKPSDEFTWFAGYTWQITTCSKCKAHLGWRFQSNANSFYGLIKDKINEE